MFLRLIFVASLVAAASAQTIDADRDALFEAIRRGAPGEGVHVTMSIPFTSYERTAAD